jgi:CcmD family protein
MSPTAAVPAHGALLYVMAVNLVIWTGIFGYVVYLDRKLRSALERRERS